MMKLSMTRLVIPLAASLMISMAGVAWAGEGATVQFGLNSFLGNQGGSEVTGAILRPTAADRTLYLDAVRDAGVRTIRETFLNWADIEPVRGGGYELDAFDDIAKKASERGIEIIALAYPFPDWATGRAARKPGELFHLMHELPLRQYEPDFRKLVATVVRRYSGQHSTSLRLAVPIRSWIFSNELDIPRFNTNPREYAYWLRVFWEEVKKADPGAKVVTMGFRHPALYGPFLQSFLDAPALKGEHYPYFDVFAFHSYPETYDPNIYVMNATEGYIREALKKRGIATPLWLTETGDNSDDENLQAQRAIRDLLHGASLGVARVNMHGLWDFGRAFEGYGQNWGILAAAPSGENARRKPLFVALETFLDVMRDNRGVEFMGPGHYKVARADGTALHVMWREGSDRSHCFRGDESLQVRDLAGHSKTLRAHELVLTPAPVFVSVGR